MKFGIAGCGGMGLPMAQHLAADRRWFVCGFDVRPIEGLEMIEDPRDFATIIDTLLVVVRDQGQIMDLLFGAQNLLGHVHSIKTIIISSTVSPKFLAGLREAVPDEITLIDAPMSGAPIAAQEARLTFMLGGDEATLDQLTPAFEVMGKALYRLGPFGAGMAAKVLNNFVAAASVVAVRQAYDWATEIGVDRELLAALMHKSSGQTWFGSQFDTIDFARHGYEPGNTIGILEKDVEAALDAVGERPALAEAILKSLRNLKPDDAT